MIETPEKYQHKPGWEALVTEGHVWHARLETLVKPAIKIKLIALVLAAAGFAVSTYAANWYMMNGKNTSREEMAEARQQPQFSPFLSIAADDVMQKIYSGDPSVGTVKPEDLGPFVAENVSSLIKTDKLAYPCTPIKSFNEKLADANNPPDVARCKTKGDKIWVGAGIYSTRNPATGWLGVFKKNEDGPNKWSYYNVYGPKVDGYDTLDPSMIPKTLKEDLPEFLTQTTTRGY